MIKGPWQPLLVATIAMLSWSAVAQNTAAQTDGVIIKGPKGSELTDVRVGQERYGPITSADTLWSIATRYRPHSSVSIEQMMAAIVEANPQAFVNGNMNRMLDGFYLRIPSLQEMQMVNPEAARRQQALDNELVEKQQQLREEAEQIQQAQAQQTQILTEARDRAAAAVEEVRTEQQAEFAALREQVGESMRALESFAAENQALRERLAELGERVADLQTQLSADGELQVQLETILAQNQSIMAAQVEQESAGTDWLAWLSNPLYLALVSILPALAILAALYAVFVRKRAPKSESEEVSSKLRELSEEEASKRLDAELMADPLDEDGPDLLDLEDDFDNPDAFNLDDEGDDLNALEEELQAEDSKPKSKAQPEDDELAPIDLSDDDANDQADDRQTDSVADDTAAADPQDDDENISQEELDRLLSGDDDDLAINLDDDDDLIDEDWSNEAAADENEVAADSDDQTADQTADEDTDENSGENAGDSSEDITDDDSGEIVDETTAIGSDEQTEEDEEASADLDAEDPDLSSAEADAEDEASATAAKDQASLLISEGDESLVPDDDAAGADKSATSDTELSLDDVFAELDIADDEQVHFDGNVDLESLLDEADETIEFDEDSPVETESLLDDEEFEHLNRSGESTDANDNAPVDYVDIDDLMDDAQGDEEGDDPYSTAAVADVLGEPQADDDAEGGLDEDSPAAQLDLARAYIEMDDFDEARVILEQILQATDDEQIITEVQALQARLDS